MKKIFLLIILLNSFIYADNLYLSNDNIVKGKILSINEEVVRIETSDGILEVNKERIVRGEFFGTGKELSGNLVFEFLCDGTIKDSSGNAFSVITKSIPYIEDKLNEKSSALLSKGDGQYFYIENSSRISEIEEFTIAMSFYPEDTSDNRFLISNWKNTYGDKKAEGRFSLSVLGTSLVFYVVDTEGYFQSISVKDRLELKKWNNLAIRFFKGTMSIYLNGQTVAENNISSETLMKGDWPIYFLTAKYGNDFKKYNIKGRIDKIKMFDSALTDNELNLLYN